MQLMAIAYFLSLCGFLGTTMVNATFYNLQNLLSTAMNDIKNNVNLNTLQLIKKASYPAEAHVVLTEDGYLLTIHRIPYGKNSPPVFLQHDLLSSSADWLVIAFILADQDLDMTFGLEIFAGTLTRKRTFLYRRWTRNSGISLGGTHNRCDIQL